tara:strand:+ start:4410 stop:4634 length:225 start_codon:yes stop_codon:yes gene_type:complete
MKKILFVLYPKIDIKISNYILLKMPSNKEIIIQYINSLNELQKLALKIAKEDLGSSFNIEKSIGFLNWIKKNKV